jgi:hypothetical protein
VKHPAVVAHDIKKKNNKKKKLAKKKAKKKKEMPLENRE